MQTRFTPEQRTRPEVAASEPILRQCVHCGFCTATCPTYLLLGDELDGPRGRIYLVKDMLEGSRPATAQVVRHLDRCLSCLGCMTTCPSGVHYQHLIDHARAYVERTYRRPWRERLVRALLAKTLPYPRRLGAALACAGLVHGLTQRSPWIARVVARSLPAPMRAMLRLVARTPPAVPGADRAPSPVGGLPAASEASSAAHDASADAGATPRQRLGRIGLLAGCAQSVLTPSTQAACARLIERAGFETVVIEGCCGALVHHLGRLDETRAFAARLIGRIEAERRRGGLDALIVNASGCGTHLKDLGYVLRDDGALAEPARELSALTRDITEWLDERQREQTDAEPPDAPRDEPPPDAAAGQRSGTAGASGIAAQASHYGLRVAYHSACSMQHGQQLDRIPRRLLERAGFEVLGIPEGHLCCGSAGTYNILQPRIAEQLRERKLANIRGTGARLIATGNVGCMVQLAGGGLPIVHTAELLDWAQGGPVPRALDPISRIDRRPPCERSE